LQDTFLGEILGAVVLADEGSSLKPKFEVTPIKVLATGDESIDGKMVVDEKHGKLVRILSKVDENAYYNLYANKLGDQYQSAKVGSFKEQTRKWRHPHDDKPSQEKCAHFIAIRPFINNVNTYSLQTIIRILLNNL
jgi:hypothetical protein